MKATLRHITFKENVTEAPNKNTNSLLFWQGINFDRFFCPTETINNDANSDTNFVNMFGKSAKPDQRKKHVLHNKTSDKIQQKAYNFIKKLLVVLS